MAVRRASWVLAASNESVGRARALVAEVLSGLPEEARDVVLLLTSELVTNAVRHGDGPVQVRLARAEESVRVEVADRSPRWPVLRTVDRDSLDGRGLLLVDGLAREWGVEPEEPGKRVWFTCEA